MKNLSYYTLLVFLLISSFIINGCSNVGSSRVGSSIIGSQVTQHLPPLYAVEYLNTIKGNCYFKEDGINLLKNGTRSELVSYNDLNFTITYMNHKRFSNNDKYQWTSSGNLPYIILFDSKEKYIITAAEESKDKEIAAAMAFGVVLLPIMMLGDPMNMKGAGTPIAILGEAISTGLSACAIEYPNPEKIMTALASLGVR